MNEDVRKKWMTELLPRPVKCEQFGFISSIKTGTEWMRRQERNELHNCYQDLWSVNNLYLLAVLKWYWLQTNGEDFNEW